MASAFTYQNVSPSAHAAKASLPESVRLWLAECLGEPTAAQCLAWPAVASGENLLLCAPTGSGKTLAAFLPILGELLTGSLTPGVRCLYVAPLKALGNDVRKNLRRHLSGLRAYLPEGWGSVRVGLRTGDTPPRVRQHQRREPPEIFLTTPESLAVILSQTWASDFFANLRWVVLDEVHALAASKRGCDLALSLERLERLAPGFQRLGLSATCTPTTEAAHYLVGVGRSCQIAEVRDAARMTLGIEPLPEGPAFLSALVARLEPELLQYRSTLIFTNTRALAERLSWQLRRRFPDWSDAIAVHHSSLAPIRRRLVERALKQGRLRAAVTSTSLELGIDIGTVDQVVLVHPPGDVVRLLQRVGRSGHGPGLMRRGLVLTSSAAELLEATVAGASSRSLQYEPLVVPTFPLDVLCQQLIGMGSVRSWDRQEALALIRRAYPYRELSEEDYDACLSYLLGRHPDGRAWLPPRLSESEATFRIVDERTARLLRRNLGTILTEEPRPVRLTDGRAVGELDEAFSERLQPGDRFLLDGRCLEYRRLEGDGLIVEEVLGRPVVPRWGSAGVGLSPELARRLYHLRVRGAEALRDGPQALARFLQEDYHLGEESARDLAAYFEEQERVSEIPDAKTLLIEVVPRQGVSDCWLHTPLNRSGNDALARVVVQRLARTGLGDIFTLVADLGWHVAHPGAAPEPESWRALLSADGFDADLAEALAASDSLRIRFGRVAQTGLMVLRNPQGRKPRVGGHDWSERRLFDQVRTAEPNFVLLRQAEREVRSEVCDAESARDYLRHVPKLMIRCRRLSQISPFVEAWTQVVAGPMETPENPGDALERLHAALMGAREQ